ncbi:MAG: very short patch repair endonuclease [Desulfuromonadales bacterium]|nr:very short patch repair endonuclease [Desulfuromonadales bacterium]
MRQVKSKDTKPEMIVRKLAHSMGYRYRLHRKDLPGKPDLTFPSRKKIIFVHGCFWHGHTCKRGARMPATNVEYWTQKIARNKERDAKHLQELADLGWRVLTLWECELKDIAALERRLRGFLG